MNFGHYNLINQMSLVLEISELPSSNLHASTRQPIISGLQCDDLDIKENIQRSAGPITHARDGKY